jgi:hypothetical protein
LFNDGINDLAAAGTRVRSRLPASGDYDLRVDKQGGRLSGIVWLADPSPDHRGHELAALLAA